MQSRNQAKRRWKQAPNEHRGIRTKPKAHRGSLSTAKSSRLSGRELLALSNQDAARLMKRATLLAAADYQLGGDLRIFEAYDPIIES